MSTEKKEDMTTRVVVGIILGIILLIFSQNSRSDSRYNLTNDELDTIIKQTNESFEEEEEAEKEEEECITEEYVPRRRIFNFFRGIRIFN